MKKDPDFFMKFLRKYNYYRKVIPDGVVGEHAVRGADIWKTVVTSRGADAEIINDAIEALKKGGYGPADLTANGVWDKKALAALEEFRSCQVVAEPEVSVSE